jgi:hypothetical protein
MCDMVSRSVSRTPEILEVAMLLKDPKMQQHLQDKARVNIAYPIKVHYI